MKFKDFMVKNPNGKKNEIIINVFAFIEFMRRLKLYDFHENHRNKWIDLFYYHPEAKSIQKTIDKLLFSLKDFYNE